MSAVVKTALISPCGRYRYLLTRRWALGALMPFVMLNPSVANAEIDDPTIRRCMGFARREYAAGIEVFNLFALRATDPNALLSSSIGLWGDDYFDVKRDFLSGAELPIVCAWGGHKIIGSYGRDFRNDARRAGKQMVCLGRTKTGEPVHPLYLPNNRAFEELP